MKFIFTEEEQAYLLKCVDFYRRSMPPDRGEILLNLKMLDLLNEPLPDADGGTGNAPAPAIPKPKKKKAYAPAAGKKDYDSIFKDAGIDRNPIKPSLESIKDSDDMPF